MRSTADDHSEEARAFLQDRIGLYWKVVFVIMLLASGMGVVGAFKSPGVDLIVDLVLAAQAGTFFWLCRRGQRSVRFLRALEAAGLLFYFAGASLLGRYVLVGFAREHALAGAEGALMADAYLATLGLVGAALMVLVRAALIPSSTRRTMLYTAMVGIPMVLVPTFLRRLRTAGSPSASSAPPPIPGIPRRWSWCGAWSSAPAR